MTIQKRDKRRKYNGHARERGHNYFISPESEKPPVPFNKAAALRETDTEQRCKYLCSVALGLRKNGRASEALSQLESAINEGWANAYIFRDAADILFVQDKHDEALSYLNRALNLNPYDSFSLRLRGEIRAKGKNYAQALLDYEAALSIDEQRSAPRHSLTLEKISKCLMALGHHEEALEKLDQCLTLNPYNHFAWTQKAQCLIDLNRPREALKAAQKVVSIAPNDLVGHKFLKMAKNLAKAQTSPPTPTL